MEVALAVKDVFLLVVETMGVVGVLVVVVVVVILLNVEKLIVKVLLESRRLW